MKMHSLSAGLVLAASVLGPPAEPRLLGQEPKNRVSLENVNLTGGDAKGFYGASWIAFSPDGKTLAAAYTDRDGTIRLWNVASGKNTATFKGGENPSRSVAFSPDGKTLASLSGEIILWDVASGQKTAVLGKGGDGRIYGSSLAFSPDGKTLASGGAEIILWDVASRKKTAALGKGGWSLAFSPDGKILASGGPGVPPAPVIELWDAASGKSIAILKDEAAVWCVAFSADSKTLAAGGDHTVRLWDAATGKKTATLSAWTENYPRDCVRSVTFSPDGKTLATGCMCQVKFWNVATGAKTAHFTAHPQWVNSVAFTPDGKTFASASFNSHNHPMVKLWDLEGARKEGAAKPAAPKQAADAIAPLHHIRWAEGTRFTSIDITPDGRYILASRDAHKTRVWDTRTGELVRDLPGYIAKLSQDGTQVIRTGGVSGVNDFHVHDLATGKELREFDAQVQIYNFGQSGTRLWLVSPQGGQVWDWSTGNKLCDFPWTLADKFGHTPDLRHVFLQVGGKPPLLVLDAETGKPVKDLYQPLRDLPHFPVALTADGKRMLTADDKTPIKVCDVATGKEFPPLEGKPTTHFTMSADGRRVLAAGSERKTFGLWDVETGRLLTILRFPEDLDGNLDHRFNYRLSHDGGIAVFVGPTDSVYVFRLPCPAKKDAR